MPVALKAGLEDVHTLLPDLKARLSQLLDTHTTLGNLLTACESARDNLYDVAQAAHDELCKEVRPRFTFSRLAKHHQSESEQSFQEVLRAPRTSPVTLALLSRPCAKLDEQQKFLEEHITESMAMHLHLAQQPDAVAARIMLLMAEKPRSVNLSEMLADCPQVLLYDDSVAGLADELRWMRSH